MSFPKQNPKIPEGINTSQEHPLKEFVALLLGVVLFLVICVTLLAVSARWLAPFIPFSVEQSLANGYLQSGSAQSNDIGSGEFRAAEAALRELGDRLLKEAELPEAMMLEFHLMDAPEFPNAFATLGGHIFVTTGLLREVSSENALAMVLAHEIAHARFRHPIRTMSSGLVVQFFLGVVLGGQASSALQGVLGQAGALTLLSFSRDMERESDAEAVEILRRHYGSLAGADEFFLKMSEQGRSANWREMFETHPDIEERIAAIRLAMGVSTSAGTLVPLDDRLRAL